MDLYERSLALKLFNTMFEEDGMDYTSSIFTANQQSKGIVISKQSGVISGVKLALEMTRYAGLTACEVAKDADRVKLLDSTPVPLLEIQGNTSLLLQIERPLCNLLMHLSGIATATAKYVQITQNFPVRICPTRKTTPGLRYWEKKAVVHGGGSLHRYGLSDGVMLKDNHIAAFNGDISNLIGYTRKNIPHTIKIEVEIDNLDQIEPVVKSGADVLLLDNFSPDLLASAVQHCRSLDTLYQASRYELGCGRLVLEASGGIDESNVLDYARSGVDIISIGGLSHSVKALNISMDLEKP